MYKRKAQVVFLDRSGQAAATAARLANELGADWLEARAAALEPQSAGGTPVLDGPMKQWADLIVHFELEAGEAARPLPATTRLKHWPLEADTGSDTPQLAAELRERVKGMVGGMRMLSRLSPDDDD